jgi:hypothetical protein
VPRYFAFSGGVKKIARLRQDGMCAVCADPLDDIYEHAHHVIPNQSGSAANQDHEWLKLIDNCVILCELCHDRVHADGHYRKGAVAPPAYFKYSHGENKAEHVKWLFNMNAKARRFWGRRVTH